MQFNEYLKSCREHAGFTQEQLMEELYLFDVDNFSGLDTSTLSKWERDIIKPRLAKQTSILKYFQSKTVPKDRLFSFPKS